MQIVIVTISVLSVITGNANAGGGKTVVRSKVGGRIKGQIKMTMFKHRKMIIKPGETGVVVLAEEQTDGI